METKTKEALSRRQFLKIAGPWAGTLAAGTIGLKVMSSSRRGESPFLTAEEKLPRELELYGQEGVGFINTIEKELNFTVPLPGTLHVQSIFGESQEIIANQLWKLEELRVLSEFAVELSENFKMDERTMLGIIKGPYGGFGGGAGDTILSKTPIIFLFAPEDYKFEDSSIESLYWPTLKDELKAVLVHELTHIKTAQNEKLIQTYADLLEWKKKGLEWVYQGEKGIVNDILARRKHALHEGPEEDLAVSAMIFATNPQLLKNSENNFDHRRLEFVKRELFSGLSVR